jgi:hypothetical protein
MTQGEMTKGATTQGKTPRPTARGGAVALLNAVLGEVRGLPGHRKSFIHKGHVHAEGDWQVPYFGKRGTTGLRK